MVISIHLVVVDSDNESELSMYILHWPLSTNKWLIKSYPLPSSSHYVCSVNLFVFSLVSLPHFSLSIMLFVIVRICNTIREPLLSTYHNHVPVRAFSFSFAAIPTHVCEPVFVCNCTFAQMCTISHGKTIRIEHRQKCAVASWFLCWIPIKCRQT